MVRDVDDELKLKWILKFKYEVLYTLLSVFCSLERRGGLFMLCRIYTLMTGHPVGSNVSLADTTNEHH